jgi:ubiquinone biosynthesis protein
VKRFDFLAHGVRAAEIFGILARNGFADLLDQAGAPTSMWRKVVPHTAHPKTTYERIRITLEELGPTFVKFGQVLSMRPDVVPEGLILELRKLQNHVQEVPYAEMMVVLDASLGKSHSRVFEDFEKTAAASASLAQVYTARVRATGVKVAVKVQKPGIAHNIQIDLDLAGWIAGQLNHRSENLRPYDLPSIVEEIRKGVLQELDFRIEARNQDYFNAINPTPEKVFAPAVVGDLSSEYVMVSEWVDGSTVSASRLPPEKRMEIAENGASSLIHQVLIDGFFHADPHEGNLIIAKDGRLAFIDWGLAGHLTRRLRHALGDFWLASDEQDPERIVQIAADLGPSEARPDLRGMEKEVMIALREELNFSTGRQQLGRAMLRLLYILGKNGMPLSRDFSLTAKAVLSIEEIARMLDPEFDLRKYARPILEEQRRERWSPKVMLGLAQDFAKTSLRGLRDLPSELTRLMRRLEHDNLTVNFQHKGLEHLEETLGTAANRVTLGVIVGALIVGSSLIVTTGAGPRLFGYPALGLIGYLISAIFGLYIVFDIIRHSRHK